MMSRVLLQAASLSTARVISLFSPLPAAATRDRLTNTNHLDGQSGERRKKGEEERKVEIVNRSSAVKMNRDKSKRRRKHFEATGYLKRRGGKQQTDNRVGQEENANA